MRHSAAIVEEGVNEFRDSRGAILGERGSERTRNTVGFGPVLGGNPCPSPLPVRWGGVVVQVRWDREGITLGSFVGVGDGLMGELEVVGYRVGDHSDFVAGGGGVVQESGLYRPWCWGFWLGVEGFGW